MTVFMTVRVFRNFTWTSTELPGIFQNYTRIVLNYTQMFLNYMATLFRPNFRGDAFWADKITSWAGPTIFFVSREIKTRGVER
jgi:hypothetical protein